MLRPYKESAVARQLPRARKNMARTRTTKKLAQRIDLNYFKRPTPLKRAKFWLSLLLPLLALVWIADRSIFKDARVYSSGRLSRAHAVLEKECAACHVQQAGAFPAKAADAACLDCHDGPIHHSWLNLSPPDCATCHMEHRGRISLSSVSSESCALCHARLATQKWEHIESFQTSHPQFEALKEGAHDRGTIKLNHAIHIKPIRRGPNGPNVQLECGNCHRPTAVDADLTYSDPKYRAATVSYTNNDEFLSVPAGGLRPSKPASGHELMAPVKFANACAACHLLTFDKRFDEGVPHDKPEIIHAFLLKKFSEYIAAHPDELREMQYPDRDVAGRPLALRTQTLTASIWVAEHVNVAEELLWHKTCFQCHSLTELPLQDTRIARWSTWLPNGSVNQPMYVRAGTSTSTWVLEPANVIFPQVAPANITLRWMPHAKFDHDAHRGFSCVSCHAKAMTSTESGDVLLPSIETCKTCHAPGPNHAEARCSECHTYHDWSKRKEVTPRFTFPALRTGGQ
jgi:hypothetical protein